MKLLAAFFITIIVETLVAVEISEHVVRFLVAASRLRARVGYPVRHFVLLLIVERQLALTHKLAIYDELLLAIVVGRLLATIVELVIAHYLYFILIY